MHGQEAQKRLADHGRFLAGWGTQVLFGAYRVAEQGAWVKVGKGPPRDARIGSYKRAIKRAAEIGEALCTELAQEMGVMPDEMPEPAYWRIVAGFDAKFVRLVLTEALAAAEVKHG